MRLKYLQRMTTKRNLGSYLLGFLSTGPNTLSSVCCDHFTSWQWWMKFFSLFPSWMVLAVPRQLYRWPAVTCESLVSQEFSRFSLEFHFSISISRHFHFTFHSQSRSWAIFISLFILDLDCKAFSFHFSFSKWVNQIFISIFTSRNEWTRFSFHFSLLELPISTLAGHCCANKSLLEKAATLFIRQINPMLFDPVHLTSKEEVLKLSWPAANGCQLWWSNLEQKGGAKKKAEGKLAALGNSKLFKVTQLGYFQNFPYL